MPNKTKNVAPESLSLIDKIKENYISALIGLIIVILGIGFISDSLNKNGKTPKINIFSNNKEEQKAPVEKKMQSNVYIVKQGDNLWKIAELKFGSGYNFVDIAKANKLVNANVIEKGQKLIIPSVTPKKPTTGVVAKIQTERVTITANTYTVQKGDHLWSIAVRAYGDGYMWSTIARANKLVNPSLIYAGTKLTLPRGK